MVLCFENTMIGQTIFQTSRQTLLKIRAAPSHMFKYPLQRIQYAFGHIEHLSSMCLHFSVGAMDYTVAVQSQPSFYV